MASLQEAFDLSEDDILYHSYLYIKRHHPKSYKKQKKYIPKCILKRLED